MRLLVIVAVLAGCKTTAPSRVRYVHAEARPSDARAAIAERAERVGMRRLSTDDDTDRYTFGRDPVTVRALPERDGSLLELAGNSEPSIELLATGGTTYRAVKPRDVHEPWHGDLTVDVGYAHAPNTSAWWRTDMSARGGRIVWARGGETTTSEPRRRLSVTGALGLVYDDRPRLRPELGVMFDVQRALSPIDGRRITQSTRKAISLAVALPFGEDHVAYEASLTLHVPPYGGVFGRVGYELGERAGITYATGLRLDGDTTLGLAGGVLLAAVAVGCGYLLVRAAARDDPTRIR